MYIAASTHGKFEMTPIGWQHFVLICRSAHANPQMPTAQNAASYTGGNQEFAARMSTKGPSSSGSKGMGGDETLHRTGSW
jgi:hypothetical protein